MTVKFITLGCKTNIYESEAMAQLFEKNGHTVTEGEKADAYIINTCTVTAVGASKSMKAVRRAKRAGGIVAVCGCLAQTEPDRLRSEGVDVLIGNKYRCDIVKLCEDAMLGKKTDKIEDILKVHEYEELGAVRKQSRIRAEIKVEDGCNNFCSYCKIPYARGPVRSRGLCDIEREARMISESGYSEIVLTGIHIGSYGRDLQNGLSLIDVIERVGQACPNMRIRLGSLEPVVISDEFIDRIVKVDGICPHFHLSLQSGCDRTLAAMRRRYTADEFEEAVLKLKKAFPEVSITTDVIVGFPGETDADFEKSLNFCKKIGFSQMHIFPYSVREGTAAAKLSGRVPENTKKERMQVMLDAAAEMKKSFYESFIGKTVPVLYEQQKDGIWCGLSENYIEVRASGENLRGELKNTCITGYSDGYAFGLYDKSSFELL